MGRGNPDWRGKYDNINNMIRKVRIIFASIVMILITLLFLDGSGLLHPYLGWLAKIQFLPAVLSLNVVVIVTLVVLTFLLGRVYCSVICPLGILQDLLARLNRKKNHYRFSPAMNVLRYVVLAVFILLIVLGLGSIAGLIAPYSTFGRVVVTLAHPLRSSWVSLALAFGMLFLLGLLSFLGGRTYCNTICPVGTVLGTLSRYSFMKMVIDTDKCKNCGKCARNCKASCLDAGQHTIDYSRCVVCGNCQSNCAFGAIEYRITAKPGISAAPGKSGVSGKSGNSAPKADTGRREFLVGAGLAIASAAMAETKIKVDGGLAVIEDKIAPKRMTPITPPGSLSVRHLQQQCTACQLCISKCPNDVLRPSMDPERLMQPEMGYENGYCRVECNTCSSVCPTGAIRSITLATKSSTQIGHAVWVAKNCVPVADGHECGNCARHCPSEAIQMIHPNGDDTKARVPVIDESRCIGCGACEYLCPARPFSAIYVEGHEVHREV